MNYLYTFYFFILGTIFGSFYNVVGYRLPREESLIKPRSHCPRCGHTLKPIELIPVLSFLIQKCRCRNCKIKISWFYTIFELATGLLFALSFWIFGFSYPLLTALSFVSMAIIIIISDYQTMIIPDEVIIFFSILFGVLIFINNGFDILLNSILNGLIAFIIMFLLKKLGDYLFKKESMGGGDIKLMFIFGLVFSWPMAVLSIFLGSAIGLPLSLITLKNKNTTVIPFGPFLCLGALIILFTQLDTNLLLELIK